MKIALASVVVVLGIAAAFLASNRSSTGDQPAVDAQALENNRQQEDRIQAEREELTTRLANCEVWIGMSAEQLVASWGRPQSRNSTESADGTRYQLVYERTPGRIQKCGNDAPERAYIYIEKDQVTAIQKHD